MGEAELGRSDAELLEHWPWLSFWLSHEVEVDPHLPGSQAEMAQLKSKYVKVKRRLSSSTSSLTLVPWPSLVDMVKVADLPDFLKDWTMTMKDRDSDINSDLVTK